MGKKSKRKAKDDLEDGEIDETVHAEAAPAPKKVTVASKKSKGKKSRPTLTQQRKESRQHNGVNGVQRLGKAAAHRIEAGRVTKTKADDERHVYMATQQCEDVYDDEPYLEREAKDREMLEQRVIVAEEKVRLLEREIAAIRARSGMDTVGIKSSQSAGENSMNATPRPEGFVKREESLTGGRRDPDQKQVLTLRQVMELPPIHLTDNRHLQAFNSNQGEATFAQRRPIFAPAPTSQLANTYGPRPHPHPFDNDPTVPKGPRASMVSTMAVKNVTSTNAMWPRTNKTELTVKEEMQQYTANLHEYNKKGCQMQERQEAEGKDRQKIGQDHGSVTVPVFGTSVYHPVTSLEAFARSMADREAAAREASRQPAHAGKLLPDPRLQRFPAPVDAERREKREAKAVPEAGETQQKKVRRDVVERAPIQPAAPMTDGSGTVQGKSWAGDESLWALLDKAIGVTKE